MKDYQELKEELNSEKELNLALYTLLHEELAKTHKENISSIIDQMTNKRLEEYSNKFKALRNIKWQLERLKEIIDEF